MSIAQLLQPVLQESSAATLYGGYAILGNGERRVFPPAKILHEVRNHEGRCTSLQAQYDDGSLLNFTWCPTNGHRYTAN